MSYPIKALSRGIISYSADDLASAPWYEIDLFHTILRHRNPKQTYKPKITSSLAVFYWQDNRPFIDTITKNRYEGFDFGGTGSCQITRTGWVFKPSIWSKQERLVLELAVYIISLSNEDDEAGRDLRDADELKKWVQESYQQRRAQADKVNFILHDNGVLSIDFLEEKPPQSNSTKKIAEEVTLGVAHTEAINGRDWVLVNEPNEVCFYTPIAREDSLCYSFIFNPTQYNQPAPSRPTPDMIKKVHDFMFTLIGSVTLTPSSRLKDYLKDKGLPGYAPD